MTDIIPILINYEILKTKDINIVSHYLVVDYELRPVWPLKKQKGPKNRVERSKFVA